MARDWMAMSWSSLIAISFCWPSLVKAPGSTKLPAVWSEDTLKVFVAKIQRDTPSSSLNRDSLTSWKWASRSPRAKKSSLRYQPQPPADVDGRVSPTKYHLKPVWTPQSCDQPPSSTVRGWTARTEISVACCCYMLLYYCWRKKSCTSCNCCRMSIKWVWSSDIEMEMFVSLLHHFHLGARLTFTRARSVT